MHHIVVAGKSADGCPRPIRQGRNRLPPSASRSELTPHVRMYRLESKHVELVPATPSFGGESDEPLFERTKFARRELNQKRQPQRMHRGRSVPPRRSTYFPSRWQSVRAMQSVVEAALR